MPKILLRIIAILLIPCLVCSSVEAASFQNLPIIQNSHSLVQFQREALIPVSFASAVFPRIKAHMIRLVSVITATQAATAVLFAYDLRTGGRMSQFFMRSGIGLFGATLLGIAYDRLKRRNGSSWNLRGSFIYSARYFAGFAAGILIAIRSGHHSLIRDFPIERHWPEGGLPDPQLLVVIIISSVIVLISYQFHSIGHVLFGKMAGGKSFLRREVIFSDDIDNPTPTQRIAHLIGGPATNILVGLSAWLAISLMRGVLLDHAMATTILQELEFWNLAMGLGAILPLDKGSGGGLIYKLLSAHIAEARRRIPMAGTGSLGSDNAANNVGLRILRLAQALGLPISDAAVKRWGRRLLAIEIPALVLAVSSAFLHGDASWAAGSGHNIISMLPLAIAEIGPAFIVGLAAALGIFLIVHLLLLVSEDLARGNTGRDAYEWVHDVLAQTGVFSLYVLLPLFFRFIGLPPDPGILIAGMLQFKYDRRVLEESVFGLSPAPSQWKILPGYRVIRLVAAFVIATHILPTLPTAGGPSDVPTSIAFEQPAAIHDFGVVHRKIMAESARGPQLGRLAGPWTGKAIQDFIQAVGVQAFFHQFVELDWDQQKSIVNVLGQTSTRVALDTLVFMLRSDYDSLRSEWAETALLNHPLRHLAAQDLAAIVRSDHGFPQWAAIRILQNTDWRMGLEAALMGYMTAAGPAGIETSKETIHRGELPSWPIGGSADAKVSKYLEGWAPSENSVLTAEYRNQLLDLMAQARRHGIDNPLRLSAEALKEFLRNRAAARPDGRPLAVVIFPKNDWNTAFADSDEILNMIWAGYRVMFYEADTKVDAINAMMASTKPQTATLIELGGHGWEKGMMLGTSYLPLVWPFSRYYLTTSDQSDLMAVRGTLAEGGHVIFKSCSTGKGGPQADNMANMLRRVFPQAAAVWAPVVSTNISRIVFDWKTHKLELVIYASKEPPYRASAKKSQPRRAAFMSAA